MYCIHKKIPGELPQNDRQEKVSSCILHTWGNLYANPYQWKKLAPLTRKQWKKLTV